MSATSTVCRLLVKVDTFREADHSGVNFILVATELIGVLDLH